MNDTLELIQSLSDERYILYRQAGRGGLLPNQEQRLNEINGRLPLLWDEYRRELAESNRPPKPAPALLPPEDIDAA
jgi:hypothetical protein